MDWMSRTRLRVLAFLLGIALTVLGTLSLTTLPAWPVVGFAVAAAAVAVNQLTSRLKVPTCLGCGSRLPDQSPGAYGVVCQECGFMTQPRWLASRSAQTDDEDDDARA